MDTKNKIAFWCYFLAIIAGPAAWGIMFLLRSEFMPYHSVAVGMPWAEVPGPFKILILALLKIVGGAWVTIAASFFVLLFIPFRQGASWARWAIPSLGLLYCAAVCNAMAHVTLNTNAVPPWGPALAGAALIVAGALLSIPAPGTSGA